MQSFESEVLLRDLQAQTETVLDLAIRDWQNTDPVVLNRQPAPGRWSAIQCLSHLNSYYDYYFPWLQKAVQYPKRHWRFLPGWLGNYFTRSMEPRENGTVKMKMKAFKQHTPPPDENAVLVLARFIENQEKMLHLLHIAENSDLNRRIVPLSIAPAIRLKTGDVFRFMIAHNNRHISQAKRALAAGGLTTVPVMEERKPWVGLE